MHCDVTLEYGDDHKPVLGGIRGGGVKCTTVWKRGIKCTVWSLEAGGGIKSLSRLAFCRRRYEQESVGQGCKHPS